MQITLHTEEFNEAVRCYLQRQGFRDSDWDINTRIVQGRNGNEARAEITLNRIEPEKIEIPFKEDAIEYKKENLDFLKRQD